MILIFDQDIVHQIDFNQTKEQNQMKDLAERQVCYDRIVELYQTIAPVLGEAGIDQSRYCVQPFEKRKYPVKRLNDIFYQLEQFITGEGVLIFKTARDLQPPGCLRQWAQDDIMTNAREVVIYKSAARLLREQWHNSGSLKSFFSTKKEIPNEKL